MISWHNTWYTRCRDHHSTILVFFTMMMMMMMKCASSMSVPCVYYVNKNFSEVLSPDDIYPSWPPEACSTAQRSNMPDHWDKIAAMQAIPAGNRCHFVLLDKDESCPTADLSNTGRPNGPAYSTGELLNTPLFARNLKRRHCFQ